MSCWITIISPDNFEISRSKHFAIIGYKKRIMRHCSKITHGDKLIFYICGIKKFGAICNVTSSLYIDETPYWLDPDEIWPCRIKIKPEIVLPKEKMLDILCLIPSLSFIPQKLKQSGNWGIAIRQSPRKISQSDYDLIEHEMKKLQKR